MGGDSENHITAVVAQIPQHRRVINITLAKWTILKIEFQSIKDLQILYVERMEVGTYINKARGC